MKGAETKVGGLGGDPSRYAFIFLSLIPAAAEWMAPVDPRGEFSLLG